jgi:hypothetical protein
MVFVLFFITYSFFFQGGGWNQNSKICLVRSMIHYGTFTIDSCREDTEEMAFANTGDWSFYGGHYYSNKSPGHAFLAVPFYSAADYILKQLYPDNHERQVWLSSYFSTICTTGFFSALLGVLMFHFFLYFCSMTVPVALLLSLFSGFGTLAFSYSTTFYTHQLSAFFSFLAFIFILHVRRDRTKRPKLLLLLAGLSISLGVLGEPSVIFILGGLAIYMVTSKRTRRYLLYFLMGGIPAGSVQIFYNSVCFGHPLSYSYQFANETIMVARDGRLFGIPTPHILYSLLLSPYRGVLFTSPVFFMSLPGFFIGLREKGFRLEILFCAIISALFFLLLASYFGWDGGATVGPRDIIGIYPFLFLVAGFAYRKFPKTFITMGVVSIVLNLAITVVGHEIPSSVNNPIGDVIVKNIMSGTVSINPFPCSHLEKYTSDYPSMYDFADVEKWKPNFNSFNLGEILFPNSLLSLLPLMCFWAVWFYLWRRLLKALPRRSGLDTNDMDSVI